MCDSCTVKHSHGPADAQDVSTRLYRAALAPDPQDRYLQHFQALDGGMARPFGWHWGAFASALGWLAWRGLFGLAALWACTALLGSVLVLGAARLAFDADARQLAMLVAGLVALASVAWGLGAHRFYHRVSKLRILQAVGSSPNITAACAQLQRHQPGPVGRGAALLVAGCAAIAMATGLVHTLQAPARLAEIAQASKHGPAPEPALPAVPVPAPAAPRAAEGMLAASAQAEPAAPAKAAPAPAPESPGAESPAPQPLAPAASAIAASAVAPPAPAATPAAPAAPRKLRQTLPAQGTRYAVQIGVFAQPGNAESALDKLRAAGVPARAERINAQGHLRVRAGPFATHAQAVGAEERIRAMGLPAVLVRLAAASD